MPKVFTMTKLVLWCEKRFDTARRVIQVVDTIVQPISLNLIVFQRMLRLPQPNKGFKITEVDDFISNNGGPKRLLLHFIDSLSRVKTSSFQFDIEILKETFREFAQLFA